MRTGPSKMDVRPWPFIGRDDELACFKEMLVDSSSSGLVLAGAAGVGKTRTAAECLASARTCADFHTSRVSGHQSSSELPFAAFAHLLPEVDTGHEATFEDRTGLLRRFASALVAQAAGRRLVLLVDDAHLLDIPSAALLYQLAVGGSAFILATVRAGEKAPDAVIALWKDGLLDRRELCGLSARGMDDLICAALGGTVDPLSMLALINRCDGNVLFLHELVRGALEDGSLTEENGAWGLNGPLNPSNRLVELVEARLGGLAQQERELLELVSFAEVIEHPQLGKLRDLKIAEILERKGLLSVTLSQGRTQIRLGHPIYGDVLRAGLPRLSVQSMARELAESAESMGLRRGDELMRVGSWRLVGGGGSPELMLSAAVEARWRYDFRLAERLASAARDLGAGFKANLLLAKLASIQGHSDAAEDMFADLGIATANDQEKCLVTIGRMDNFLYASRSMESLRIASEAETAISDLRWRDEITGRKSAGYVTVAGPRATLEVVTPLLAGTASETAFVWAALTGAHALGRLGLCREAVALTERGRAAQLALKEPIEWYPWFHLYNRCEALLAAGRRCEAAQIARQEYDAGMAESSPEAQACFAHQLAKVSLAGGQVLTAAARANEAISVFRRIGRPLFLHEALTVLALAQAQGSTGSDGCGALSELDQVDLPHLTYDAVDLLQARAWHAIARGQVTSACQLLEDAARTGLESGDLVVASSALHDLARLGRAREVTKRLDYLATQIDAGLIDLRAAHARHLAVGDATGLQEVGVAFESLGFIGLAADAAADAAVAWTRLGNTRAATAATRLAIVRADLCEGMSTPSLRSIDARARLTPAERETATMAAAGCSNKKIASELVLSVRSVENRLQRVYEKLGISTRAALGEALNMTAGADDDLVKSN